MKNIYVLPTSQPSRLVKQKYDTLDRLCLADIATKRTEYKRFNIYITSDEEIKEGDWFITDKNTICKCVRVDWKYAYSIEAGSRSKNNCKKIILTTDQDLIKNGVEVINDDFLEWFVKNPSCEEVVIDFDYNSYKLGKSKSKCYKIIIPKEEPTLKELYLKNNPERNIVIEERVNNFMKQLEPKQETIEEASENYSKTFIEDDGTAEVDFIAGAKWQAKRSYSEEEVLEILKHHTSYFESFIYQYIDKNDMEENKEWFEQFKKK